MSVVESQLRCIDNCDAGDVVELIVERTPVGPVTKVVRQVAMVVTAPRGRAVVFAPSRRTRYDNYYGTYLPQSEAVKAFMEQHRGE